MIGRASWKVSQGSKKVPVVKEIDIPLGTHLISWDDCDKYVMSKLVQGENFHPVNDDVKIEYVNHISTVKIVR